MQRYSPTGQEGPAVGYLVDRMAELGYTRSFVDPAGNAVGIMGDGGRQIVLLGHIDTVPGEIPVRVVGRNGILADSGEAGPALYGRGSVDAKGALAAFTDAVAAVGVQPGWQFVVIGAVDEEGDSRGARFAVEQYRPEFAVIGEPSRWERVTLGYKGSAWVEVTCRRVIGHTAAQGESASEAAFAAWGQLVRWAEGVNSGRSRLFDRVLLTLRGLASGSDGFEEWARLQVGARLPLDIPPSAWYADLTAAPPRREVPAYRLCPSGLPWREEHPPGARFSGGHPRRRWGSWFRAKDRYRRPEPGRARLGLPGFGLWPRRFEPGPHPGRAYSPGGIPAGGGRLAKHAYEINFQPGRG